MIVYSIGYDVIFNSFWAFILAYYVILGAQRAMLLNILSYLSLSSTMETLDSPILLSRSFEKCVAAFVAPLSAADFSNLCPFLHVSVILALR